MTRTIDAQTSHGPVSFHYCISTPTNDDSDSVDAALPTVLFLHPAYIASSIFHPQFADPTLRRFNLVSLDLLSHGRTQGAVPAVYTEREAAEDVNAFMDALKLPACTVFALSMGTIIALRLALSFPEKVNGLFLVSPLGAPEPEDAANGRRQVFEVWKEAYASEIVDQEALSDSVFGGLQLCWNSQNFGFANALTTITFPQCQSHWPPANFPAFESTTVTFFTSRKGEVYSSEELDKLRKVPIVLAPCSDDIAYPPEYFESFARQLEGGRVTKYTLKGAPHYGSATHWEAVDPVLANFVLEQWKGASVPAAPEAGSVASPFETMLREAGWTGNESDDSDD
ncbi:alpha/beta-hydrolase [Exidia glandulosa HHB12029]|uniref:Alpha/beta-hydrolase n=1 Tax=Exidia glandulosa HHB12029 TaxID=1314781 RepID=A0A165EKC1_EXIGL|nr:alpha/beta-hydrolase [Exidia glandulosa HHB12029]